MKLWKVGLLAVIIGGLINAILIQNEIGGIMREFMRLVVLSGVGMFIFGIFKVINYDTENHV